MTSSLAGFNPSLTTNASGLFFTNTAGYIQGHALDDPAIRYQLRSGIWAASNNVPAWGGMGISEATPAAGADVLGPQITLATNVTNAAAGQLTGFTVFNEAINLINNPQSPVPTAGSGMGVNFFRLGSGITVPLACAPGLISAIDGNVITTQVSWDYNAQQLVPYVAAYPVNLLTASAWSANVATWTTATAHGVAVGDYFTISGSVPNAWNGDYLALTGTTGSTLVAALVGNPGAIVTEGQLNAGGGALPVKITSIVSNGLIVSYNAATNFATYVSGVTALCQL